MSSLNTWVSSSITSLSNSSFNSCSLVTPGGSNASATAILVGGVGTNLNGIIYSSIRGGVVCSQRLTIPSNNSALQSCEIVGTHAIAVGGSSGNPVIYISTAAGSGEFITWNAVTPVFTNIQSLTSCSINTTNAIVVGSLITNSTSLPIYFSNNSGASWTQTTSSAPNSEITLFNRSSINLNNTVAISVGNVPDASIGAAVYYSLNTGSGYQIWNTGMIDNISTDSTFTFCCSGSGNNMLAVGAQHTSSISIGVIHRCVDAGATWVVSTPTLSGLNPPSSFSCCAIYGSNAIAVGTNGSNQNGFIFSSTDSGENWTLALNLSSMANSAFTFCTINGSNALAVGGTSSGTAGIIYFSTDAGSTWTRVTSSNLSSSSILRSGVLAGTSATEGLIVGTPNPTTNTGSVFYSSATACFNEGTKILCLNKNSIDEYIPIENLRKGDLVKTYKHGYRKIDFIGKKSMVNDPDRFCRSMYKMEKTNSNCLIEDLILTGGHSILVDDLDDHKEKNDEILDGVQMIDDKFLLLACVSKDFIQIQTNEVFNYYHLVLETGSDDNQIFGVWANGILAETTTKNVFLSHDYNIL